ncbi:MAG: hypothetical protein J7539_17775 [Niabella sp.]|nr:hypothetical protein [Niabella sp.]
MRCRVENRLRKLITELCALGLLLAVTACDNGKRILSKTELESYINDKDNGLVKETEVNGVKACITYFPSDFLTLQEKENNVGDTLAKKNNKYDSMYYFKLKYSIQDKEAIRQLGSFNRYSEMVQVLAFRMGRYINLTTPTRDTVQLADYFFDQTYGMNNGNTLLLCFPKAEIKTSPVFDINISECGFGTGALKFAFKRSDINNVPKLDMEPTLHVKP